MDFGTLAPALFNLYFSAVVATWRTASSVPGVDFRYRVGRKLVGDRTAKSRLSPACLTESQFADDAALYTTSLPFLETMANEFIECASQWGLTVSIQKTKAMVVNPHHPQPASVTVGSTLSTGGSLDKEVTSRPAKTSRVFGRLQKPIFQCRGLSLHIKRTV
eukprot:scpid93201/ scgid21296/ 